MRSVEEFYENEKLIKRDIGNDTMATSMAGATADERLLHSSLLSSLGGSVGHTDPEPTRTRPEQHTASAQD